MIAELRSKCMIRELVCPHCISKYREAQLWSFLDIRLLATLYVLRLVIIKKEIVINNSTKYTQRGLRCNICELVLSKSLARSVYITAHSRGQAFDFHVPGMSAEEVRQLIIKDQEKLPYPIRIEKDVNWVHVDVCVNVENVKVQLFNG